MAFSQERYRQYLDILREELLPAMGCTEPIAVAYAAALAARELGRPPQRVSITVSGNIIKNVKSVVVPNTGGLRGLEAAAAAGIAAGDPDRELEVIADVTDEQREKIAACLKQTAFQVAESGSGLIFDIDVALFGDGHTASCRIAGYHTHVVQLERDGRLLIDEPAQDCAETHATDRTLLNVADIVTFADEVDVDDVKDLLDRQISFNMAIARAGMDQPYGARIGRILMDAYGDTVFNRAKAMAAAASDARMNGCSLPVAINSGVICDGAKSSCAAKIASAVEAGLLGMQMAQRDSEFYGGDCIVIKGVENTISNVSRLAREGMAETGKKIIDLMLG